MSFEGVENADLYRQDYDLFKKGLASQNEVKAYFDDLYAKLDQEKSRIYSPEFLKFDRGIRAYELKQMDLIPFLAVLEKKAKEILKLELSHPLQQADWPYLCRMLRVRNAERGLDMDAVQRDVEALKQKVKSKEILKGLSVIPAKAGIQGLSQSRWIPAGVYPGHRSGAGMTRRDFFESLYAESLKENFSLEGYTALRQFAEHFVLQSEIAGPEFFKEIESLINRLSDAMANTPQAKELLNRSRQVHLLGKVLKFEATSEEWERIRSSDFSRFTKSERINSLLQTVRNFYTLAEQRNAALLENTLAKMKERGIQKAILVTGGFHTAGISTLLKQKNISTLVIQPRIREEFGNNRYREAMMDTWKTAFDRAKIQRVLGEVENLSQIQAMGGNPNRHVKKLLDAVIQMLNLVIEREISIDPSLKNQPDKLVQKIGESLEANPHFKQAGLKVAMLPGGGEAPGQFGILFNINLTNESFRLPIGQGILVAPTFTVQTERMQKINVQETVSATGRSLGESKGYKKVLEALELIDRHGKPIAEDKKTKRYFDEAVSGISQVTGLSQNEIEVLIDSENIFTIRGRFLENHIDKVLRLGALQFDFAEGEVIPRWIKIFQLAFIPFNLLIYLVFKFATVGGEYFAPEVEVPSLANKIFINKLFKNVPSSFRGVLIHEMMHRVSKGGFWKNSFILNEGATELYSWRASSKLGYSYPVSLFYLPGVLLYFLVEKIVGARLALEAYLTQDMGLLTAGFSRASRRGGILQRTVVKAFLAPAIRFLLSLLAPEERTVSGLPPTPIAITPEQQTIEKEGAAKAASLGETNQPAGLKTGFPRFRSLVNSLIVGATLFLSGDVSVNLLQSSTLKQPPIPARPAEPIAPLTQEQYFIQHMGERFEQLADTNEDVRLTSAQFFRNVTIMNAHLITPAIVERMLEKLGDSNESVRNTASAFFKDIAEEHVELITPAILERLFEKKNVLDDDNSSLAALEIILTLQTINPRLTAPFFVDEHFKQLLNSNPNIRMIGARFFAKFQEYESQVQIRIMTPAIVERMLEKLEDSDERVRGFAINFLLTIVKDNYYATQVFTPGNVARMLERLDGLNENIFPFVRTFFMELARNNDEQLITPAIVERMLERLGDSNEEVSNVALNFLNYFDEGRLQLIAPAIIEPMFEKVGDSDESVRTAAVRFFAQFARVNVTGQLITPAIVERMFEKIGDSNKNVRRAAVDFFSNLVVSNTQLITSAIIERMFEKSSDSDEYSRRAAVYFFMGLAYKNSQLITPAIIERMFEKLEDPDAFVQEIALRFFSTSVLENSQLITPAIVDRIFGHLDDQRIVYDGGVPISVDAVTFFTLFAERNAQLITPAIVDRIFGIDDPNESVHRAVVRFFEKNRQLIPSAIEEMAARLWSSNLFESQAARESLVKTKEMFPHMVQPAITHAFVRLYLSAEFEERRNVLNEFRNWAREDSAKDMISNLLDAIVSQVSRENAQLLEPVLWSMVSEYPQAIDSELAQKIIEKLNHSDASVRARTLSALQGFPWNNTQIVIPVDLVTAVRGNFSHLNEEVQAQALFVFAIIADRHDQAISRETVREIIELLKASPRVRERALGALNAASGRDPGLLPDDFENQLLDLLIENLNEMEIMHSFAILRKMGIREEQSQRASKIVNEIAEFMESSDLVRKREAQSALERIAEGATSEEVRRSAGARLDAVREKGILLPAEQPAPAPVPTPQVAPPATGRSLGFAGDRIQIIREAANLFMGRILAVAIAANVYLTIMSGWYPEAFAQMAAVPASPVVRSFEKAVGTGLVPASGRPQGSPLQAYQAPDTFSMTIKMGDRVVPDEETLLLSLNPRAVTVIVYSGLEKAEALEKQISLKLDKNNKPIGERIKIIPIKPGEEIETIRDLLTGEGFNTILRLAKELSDQSLKKQTEIFKRTTVLASSGLLAELGDLRVEKLEAISEKELETLGIGNQAFAGFAALVALHLGAAEGDQNKLTEALRVSVKPRNGIFGWDRSILSAMVTALENVLQAYRRILASA